MTKNFLEVWAENVSLAHLQGIYNYYLELLYEYCGEICEAAARSKEYGVLMIRLF